MVIDIPEENLHCHHILFIKDVTSSIYSSTKDCFKTQYTNLSYRRARLNGVIVAQESLLSNKNEHYIWLDDGTSVIRAILSGTIMMRKDSYMIDLAAAVTVFGKIELYPDTNEVVIRCGGFKVEEDCTAEIYHWLKAIQERPKDIAQKQPPNMFYSLSSFPSPNRLLNEEFLQSPIRDINAQNAGYLWSPDHTFATSTPIRAVQESNTQAVTPSPLRQTNLNKVQETIEDEDEDDEFDSFGDIDLAAFEADALQKQVQNRPSVDAGNKRKWILTMD